MRTGSGIALLLALVLAAFLAGCGGGGGAPSGARTQATVTINWPERTRAIPLNAESLLVKLSDTDGFDAVQIADRPVDGGPSTLVVEVPVGRLFVTAAAYPAQQATGNALAVASSEVTTQAGVSTPFALTLQSTVASLAIGAESVTIDVGASRHLTATPLDAAGVAVLCAPENLTWTSSDPAVLAVDPYGNIRGMAAGTATVTVRESDSGLTATLPLTVRVGPNGLPSEAVLQEEVVVLPTDGSVTVQQTAGNTLVLGGASPTLQPGDIIVHDQPSYLLAKVVSATRTRSGDMMVETAPAAIEEAFRELDIDL
ncbi:MAG TPA: Ig-like domain-containing protein, partial [Armatimonadota bacterium]|nr:Ig-like domain-containing protein [Armatimonadota bacterium]